MKSTKSDPALNKNVQLEVADIFHLYGEDYLFEKTDQSEGKITGKSQRNGSGNDAACDRKRHYMLSEMQERENDNNQKFAKTE